jgi:hypothetical protein
MGLDRPDGIAGSEGDSTPVKRVRGSIDLNEQTTHQAEHAGRTRL